MRVHGSSTSQASCYSAQARPRSTNNLVIVFFAAPVILTVEQAGMRLWRCGTRQADGRKRLIPAGEMIHVGFWRFDEFDPGGDPFDQGDIDPFDDLGNPDIEVTGL
jgi:hypothetical protein